MAVKRVRRQTRRIAAALRRCGIALPLAVAAGGFMATAARADWAINGGTVTFELFDSSTDASPFFGGNDTTFNVAIVGPSASWVIGTSGAPVDLNYAVRQAAVSGRSLSILDGGELILYSNHSDPGNEPAVAGFFVSTSDVEQVVDGRIHVYDSSGDDQQTDGFMFGSVNPLLLRIDDDADVYVESATDSAAIRSYGDFQLSTLRGSLEANSTGRQAYGLRTSGGSVFVVNNSMEAAIAATAGGNGAYGIFAEDSAGTVSGATFAATLDVTGSIVASAADHAYGIHAGGGMNVRIDDAATISAIANSGTNAFALFGGAGGNSSVEIVAGATVVGRIRLNAAADSLVLSGAANDSTTLGAIIGAEAITVSGGQWMLDGVVSGASSLATSGTAILHLRATNTFSGGVNLGGGTIVAGNDAAFSASNISVSANTTLHSDDDDRYLANNFTVAGATTLTIDGGDDLELGGNLGGAGGVVKTGAGTLVLGGTNSYAGATTLGGGTIVAGNDNALSTSDVTVSANSTLRSNDDDRHLANDIDIAAATTLTVDGSNNLELGGELSGGGGIAKSGAGTLLLSGNNTYSGPTNLNGGRLVVNGQITSDVAAAVGTTVAGTGTIVGDVDNGGTVAPGNSIGTLLINGNYTHVGGANLEIEINDGGTAPGTNVDWLDVTGTATIQGGTVEVVADAGSYAPFAQYTFLTAGSVSGTFDSITDNLAFLDAVLGYTGTSVHFTLQPNSLDFAAIGITFNQRAVGAYFDEHLAANDGDWQSVVAAFAPLTTVQALSGLEQLSGEIHASIPQVNLQTTTFLLSSLARQIRPQGLVTAIGADAWWPDADAAAASADSTIVLVAYRDDGTPEFYCPAPRHTDWTVWTMGLGLGGDASSDGNAAALDYSVGSALVGIECAADADHRLGLFGGYVGTDVRTHGIAQTGNIHSGTFGGFLVRQRDWSYTVLIGGFQFDDLQSRRFVQFGGIDRTIRANYDGWQGYGYWEQGVSAAPFNSLWLQPFGALQYVHLRQNGFTETGAGALNLQVSGEDADSLRTFCGARLRLDSPFAHRWRVSPEMRAVWIHELLDTNSLVNARFAPIGGNSFTIRGLDLGRDWVQAGLGAGWDVYRGWQFCANYDAFANGRQVAHVASGNVSYVW